MLPSIGGGANFQGGKERLVLRGADNPLHSMPINHIRSAIIQ